MSFRIVVFLGTLMTVFVIDREMRVFFDKRRTSFPVYAASFLFYMISMNVASMFHIPWGGMVISLAARLIASLNYEGTWKRRAVMLVSLMAIGMTIEMGAMQMLGVYYSAIFDAEAIHTIWSVTISSLAQFMVALALQRLRNLKKDPVSSPAALVVIFAVPLSSTILAMVIAAYADMPPPVIFLASSIIFGVNVLVFYMRDRLSAAGEAKLQAALYAREKEYYLAQCQLMQESLEQTASIRHDMKAHMAAAQGLAAKAGADEAADYLGGLLGGMDAIKAHSATGNPVFDSVINYKLRNAERDGVKPDIRLRVPPSLNIEASDIAAILGNLIDNALDAVARVEEKKIRLNVEYSRETLFILVENAFDGEISYAGGAGKNGLPATRKSGGDHGHGLRNVRRAVEKHNGYLEIVHEGGIFSARALLYASGDAQG